jgi:hypothetical protein
MLLRYPSFDMKLRRLSALLTSAAMLHLWVATGDAACVQHGTQRHHATPSNPASVAEHATGMDGHVMTTEVSDAPAFAVHVAKADLPPCDAPAQQHCCDTVVGCSVSGVVTSERQLLASTVLSASHIQEARHDAPASFAPAPEPPPPKA